jgi:hypothetical protein
MNYKGTLYGKVEGKYVPIKHNAEYYDSVVVRKEQLEKEARILKAKIRILEATR